MHGVDVPLALVVVHIHVDTGGIRLHICQGYLCRLRRYPVSIPSSAHINALRRTSDISCFYSRYAHEPINVAWYLPTSDESANSGSLDMTQRPDKTGNAAAPATSLARLFPLKPERPPVAPLPFHRARITDAPSVACTNTQPTRPAYKIQLRKGHVCSAVLTNSKSSSDGPRASVSSEFMEGPVRGDAGNSLCVTT